MSRSLALVSKPDLEAETPSQRTSRLHAEARIAAAAQISVLLSNIQRLALDLDEIANGGELFGAGVRDLAKRLSDDLMGKANTLQAITGARR